jgi:hypothetical protein
MMKLTSILALALVGVLACACLAGASPQGEADALRLAQLTTELESPPDMAMLEATATAMVTPEQCAALPAYTREGAWDDRWKWNASVRILAEQCRARKAAVAKKAAAAKNADAPKRRRSRKARKLAKCPKGQKGSKQCRQLKAKARKCRRGLKQLKRRARKLRAKHVAKRQARKARRAAKKAARAKCGADKNCLDALRIQKKANRKARQAKSIARCAGKANCEARYTKHFAASKEKRKALRAALQKCGADKKCKRRARRAARSAKFALRKLRKLKKSFRVAHKSCKKHKSHELRQRCRATAKTTFTKAKKYLKKARSQYHAKRKTCKGDKACVKQAKRRFHRALRRTTRVHLQARQCRQSTAQQRASVPFVFFVFNCSVLISYCFRFVP